MQRTQAAQQYGIVLMHMALKMHIMQQRELKLLMNELSCRGDA